MADEKTPEQLQQEMFNSATQAPEPATTETPAPAPEPAPQQEPAPAESPPASVAAAVPPTPEPLASEAPIPSWRLREEAERARQAEDRARQLEERLNAVAAHLQQQQKQPDFFENPDQATQALILRTLQPYAEENRRQMMYMGKMVANAAHGADKVEEAEQAFIRARDDQSLDPTEYERVVQSPNRYDEVVRWHRRQTTLSSVGDDPEAWYQKRRQAEREAEMNDPKFQAEIIQRSQKGAANRPSETRLPPSLSRSTGTGGNSNEPVGDMSDRSLFEYATKPQSRPR